MPIQVKLCKECDGSISKMKRHDSDFCSSKCRNKYWIRKHPRINRRLTRQNRGSK